MGVHRRSRVGQTAPFGASPARVGRSNGLCRSRLLQFSAGHARQDSSGRVPSRRGARSCIDQFGSSLPACLPLPIRALPAAVNRWTVTPSGGVDVVLAAPVSISDSWLRAADGALRFISAARDTVNGPLASTFALMMRTRSLGPDSALRWYSAGACGDSMAATSTGTTFSTRRDSRSASHSTRRVAVPQSGAMVADDAPFSSAARCCRGV